MSHYEPGDEAGEESDPGREQHGDGGHATPEEDKTNGDAGAAYDYAEDGKEPG